MHVPEPIVGREDGTDPEHEALLADSVGLALLVVLETLAPAERLAFVLHDMFAVPFDEIAPIVDRSPAAARQLASRARRRVPGRAPAARRRPRRASARWSTPSSPPRATATSTRCVAVLDPDVVLRADVRSALAGGSREVRGAEAVARQALSYSRMGLHVRRGARQRRPPGAVATRDGEPFSVEAFTVRRREDHRDRHPRRPRAPAPPRPVAPRRLTGPGVRRGGCRCRRGRSGRRARRPGRGRGGRASAARG